ncbi:hypothetical protein [Saccharothrix violaceirubra]|uniref:Uncharacterized protein n=1 Tax=Saccharothrix violaceirubra TaxID=413306 RepID=A0A7W7T0J9_9PSEU|nr:hypothetical protein [Saccharothrix violaceirubra]MBB4963045.1 hypothetical protein [Saccharothrix violaceirubra]
MLDTAGRHANADHFAGIAAECALKGILHEFLGATPNQRGLLEHPQMSGKKEAGHLPGLWSQLSAVATGRNAAQFAELISAPNPFASWDVAERYSDGTHISDQRSAEHLAAARNIIALYERAKIDGVLS